MTTYAGKCDVPISGDPIACFHTLHNYYLLNKNHIVHAYAEPQNLDPASGPEAMWFYVMNEKRKLVDMPFKDYIHPEGDVSNGYYDHCFIEEGTFDYDNMNEGEVFPVILYFHHKTQLTVGSVVKTSERLDIVTGKEQLALYIYYPTSHNLNVFEMFTGHVYMDED